MPDWMIWVFLGWVIFGLTGRGRCGSRGSGRPRGRDALSRGDGSLLHLGSGSRWQAPRSDRTPHRRPVPSPPPPESAERRLAREFVEGQLSMEEYEEALWRELGPGTGAGATPTAPDGR